MSLLSRLIRLEKQPCMAPRINRIIETIVEPAPGWSTPVPVAVIRENLASNGVVLRERWDAPDIPEPLPAGVDLVAMERFRRC
jgi:hypothetical protein